MGARCFHIISRRRHFHRKRARMGLLKDWLLQIGKEAIGLLLTASITWIGHTVARAVRDLNASFRKIRSIEQRLKSLDGKDADNG